MACHFWHKIFTQTISNQKPINMKTRLHVLIAAFIMHTGTVANAQCTGGNQYANQGFVNDGGTQTNYTNNENCSWLLESAMGGTIYLGFYNFITEGSLDVFAHI
jgi:hypothetical protein